MNACIRAIAKTAIKQGLQVAGIERGYQGLIDNQIVQLTPGMVDHITQLGGTILHSSRCPAFREAEGRAKAAETLRQHSIDALVAIGGDGTLRGALKLWEEHQIPTVATAGTIDNDMWGTDYTIGYDTAVNTAVEAIDRIRDTAESHGRIFFVEVMGRDSGYLALEAAVSGGCESVLIPESKRDFEHLEQFLSGWKSSTSSAIVVVAEGDESGGVIQTVQRLKGRLDQFSCRVVVLGHIQRGGSPTARDRIIAARTGQAAVEGLLEGRHSQFVGIINNEVAYTPFAEVVANKKELPPSLLHLLETL